MVLPLGSCNTGPLTVSAGKSAAAARAGSPAGARCAAREEAARSAAARAVAQRPPLAVVWDPPAPLLAVVVDPPPQPPLPALPLTVIVVDIGGHRGRGERSHAAIARAVGALADANWTVNCMISAGFTLVVPFMSRVYVCQALSVGRPDYWYWPA